MELHTRSLKTPDPIDLMDFINRYRLQGYVIVALSHVTSGWLWKRTIYYVKLKYVVPEPTLDIIIGPVTEQKE
jgi:hypothetical protein